LDLRWKGGSGSSDMGSTNFKQSLLGQAVKQSVNDTARDWTACQQSSVNALPLQRRLDGLVTDASAAEDEILINAARVPTDVGDKPR